MRSGREELESLRRKLSTETQKGQCVEYPKEDGLSMSRGPASAVSVADQYTPFFLSGSQSAHLYDGGDTGAAVRTEQDYIFKAYRRMLGT